MSESEPETKPVPHILKALVAIAAELAKVGVSKDRVNDQQHFKFRGVDDVMNACGPIFARNDAVLIPDYIGEPDEDRVAGKNQTPVIFSKLTGKFTCYSAIDGSSVTITTLGKAMDSGDKGTNKAMSAALKYALLHTFLIPTEANEDADATTQEASAPKPPPGFEDFWLDLIAIADEGFGPLGEVFSKSPEKYRHYIRDYRKGQWDDVKAKARAVTKAAAKQQEATAP